MVYSSDCSVINILKFNCGKWQNIGYSEAAGKRCLEKVAILKKSALPIF